MIEFTTVLGVDAHTIQMLRLVWPTWVKFKPTVTNGPLVVFYDNTQITKSDVMEIIGSTRNVTYVPWPWIKTHYPGDDTSKWTNVQRAKMLAGFVHAASLLVKTTYWLKVDVDVVATGDDDWVQQSWLEGDYAIIAPSWSYTKPANQMLLLDGWVERHRSHLSELSSKPPLRLSPLAGSDKVIHPRIASWCAFFNTEFTKRCAAWAEQTCGPCQLPVPSQDGYQFYVAKRLQLGIRTISPKSMGWVCCANLSRVKQTLESLDLK